MRLNVISASSALHHNCANDLTFTVSSTVAILTMTHAGFCINGPSILTHPAASYKEEEYSTSATSYVYIYIKFSTRQTGEIIHEIHVHLWNNDHNSTIKVTTI